LKDRFKGPLVPNEFAVREDADRLDLGCSWNEIEAIHGARMTFRREAVARHDFDPQIMYHDETELSIRIRRDSKIICIHEPLIFHAEASGQIHPRKSQMQRANFLVSHAYMCRKLMQDSNEMRKYVRRYGARTRIIDFLTGVSRRNLDRWRGAMNCSSDIEAVITASNDRYAEVYGNVIEKWRSMPENT
jgi:GT2 family glycosyltransferase